MTKRNESRGATLAGIAAPAMKIRPMASAQPAARATAPAGLEIHRQHLEIFHALDTVREVWADGSSLNRLGLAFDEFLDRTHDHFRDEEAILQHYGHPKFSAHQATHGLILEHIARLRGDLDVLARRQFLPQLRFVDYWLTTHVFEENSRLF